MWAFASVATLAAGAAADEIRPDGELAACVDSLFADWDRPEAPGGAVGVLRDGELIYARGFGSANLDHEVPNTPRTVFEVGSMAKAFTAACVALLMDDGKISPDDDVRKFVPELHAFETPIRVRHLVRCESGLWAQWHLVQLAGWTSEPVQTPYTNEDFLTLLAGQDELPFPPGDRFHYGTSDYFLLATIVERVSGMPFPEFARRRLFEPLGMTRTFYQQDATAIVKGRAVGYYQEGTGDAARWRGWSAAAAGAGGWNLKSCVEDLARWERNFLDDRISGGAHWDVFLREGTLLGNRNVLDARPTGEYRGTARVQFTGGMPGFMASFSRYPEHRLAVICLCNNSEIAPWEKASQIADAYLADELAGEPETGGPADDEAAFTPMPAEELSRLVGAYQSTQQHVWRIRFDGTVLRNTNHLGETYELKPVGVGRFQPSRYPEDRFVFARESPESPYQLTLVYRGGESSFQRVELVDPTSIVLDDYVGEFTSEALATTYRFSVRDGALAVRVGARRWEKLDPTLPDVFIPHVRRPFDHRVFTFVRTADGDVASVRVALWRVGGVSFRKQE